MPLTLMGIEVEYYQIGEEPSTFFGAEVEYYQIGEEPGTFSGVEVEYYQIGEEPGTFFGVEVETTLGSESGLAEGAIVEAGASGGGAQIVGSPIVHPVGRTLV